MNDDIQDQLVKAYLEYFKANDKWEKNLSYRTYYATQRWLREIRRLAKEKQVANKDHFKDVKQAIKDEGKE